MDRISNLPDEIICHILCFLRIKEAALTSLLSKRWRNLFAFTPELDLLLDDPKGNIGSFIGFVDRVLPAVPGGGANHTIRKFSFVLQHSVWSYHINRWITNVLRRGILDLNLIITNQVTLPSEIFTCKTIVKLKLGGGVIAKVPKNASLPALKTLSLSYIQLSCIGFEAFLSACHVLEELTVIGDLSRGKPCLIVSCPTLKRLKAASTSRTIAFDTPNLVYLDYRDYIANEYPTVNLNSLVEAKLDLERPFGERNPTNLIKGLRNVEILELSSHETAEIFHSFAEAIPLFENLSRLSIATAFGSCWELVPLLLKKTPNLETLVINGFLHHYNEYLEEEHGSLCGCLSEYSFLSCCSMKVLEITKYRGTKGDSKQMKLIMEKSPCLELVKVHASKDAKLSFAKDLLMLPITGKIELKVIPYTK